MKNNTPGPGAPRWAIVKNGKVVSIVRAPQPPAVGPGRTVVPADERTRRGWVVSGDVARAPWTARRVAIPCGVTLATLGPVLLGLWGMRAELAALWHAIVGQ